MTIYNIKRLFFGMEVHAPWPHELPEGRLIQEQYRHMTIAFLGNADLVLLLEKLKFFIPPSFKVGLVGKFHQCLFLPKRDPHVVAWEIEWLEKPNRFISFYHHFMEWLEKQGFSPDKKHADFLPHVTLCRSPFNVKEWEEGFQKLPFSITSLNLYESVGNSVYEVRWKYPFVNPFKEIEHTADIAFEIYGESLNQLYNHAVAALAFKYPPFLHDFIPLKKIKNLDELIISLNQLITKVDSEIGCPFKAVSFHDLLTEESQLLKWEMIVDV
jgi:RNA 2',3'-cyclic 3'-phosphodiesterase